MVTLSWSIPLGEIVEAVALRCEEGNHLGLVVFSDRGVVAPGCVPVDMIDPLARSYIARPWIFTLDSETGQRKQTVCLCFVRSD